MDEVLLSEEMIRSRNLKGFVARLSRAILISIPVLGVILLLEVPQRLGWLIFQEQYLGLFLSLTLCATFLIVPEGVSGHRDRVILGCIAVLLLSEATRRLTGWSLAIIAAIFLFYALFAYLFPGPFYGRGWSINRIATYLYLDRNGIFGQSLEVAAGIVLVFILFG